MKILIKGLDTFEQRIIQTTVKLYEKRETHFTLVSDTEVDFADAIVVDAKSEEAMEWAKGNSSLLNGKSVIWIDGVATNKLHAELKRPVLWVNLPIIVSRIMDDISVLDVCLTEKTSAPERTPHVEYFDAAPEEHRKSVLVVDDSLAIRNYLSSLLDSEGYAVQTAEDGENALELINSGNSYDCIFMDVLMPGMDGYATCRKIKGTKQGKTIPVIMLTGKGSAFDRIRGRMAGCVAYLVKPVSVKKLQQTLNECLL